MRAKDLAYIATALLVGAVAMLAGGLASASGPWGADYFPNVLLTTQDGTTVHFYDDLLKGKKVAINLIYTSCKDECPLETARLVQVQQLLGNRVGRDIFFYSISIDPEAGGQWMRNSAVDNPRFLATTIGNFFGWTSRQPTKSYAEASASRMPEKQEYLFQSRCGACRTIGNGDRVGPDLAGVTTRRDRAWLTRYLAEPDRVRAEGDPIATALFEKYNNVPMPNLRLSSAEIRGLLSYLETHGARGQEVQQEATAAH